jgi:hypothetical protein
MLYVRYVHLTKGQAYSSSDRMLHKECERKGSVKKKESLVVSLKGPDAKTNWLEVNRQS